MILDYLSGPNVSLQEESSRISERDVAKKVEVRMMWGHKQRSAGSLGKLEKVRKQILPRGSSKNTAPADPFRLLTSITVR